MSEPSQQEVIIINRKNILMSLASVTNSPEPSVFVNRHQKNVVLGAHWLARECALNVTPLTTTRLQRAAEYQLRAVSSAKVQRDIRAFFVDQMEAS